MKASNATDFRNRTFAVDFWSTPQGHRITEAKLAHAKEVLRVRQEQDHARAVERATREAARQERRAAAHRTKEQKATDTQPDRVDEALAHPSWQLVTRRGVVGLEQMIEHVPIGVRRAVFNAKPEHDPILAIWRSLRPYMPETNEVIGWLYGLTRERIRQIDEKLMRKLERNKNILAMRNSVAAFDHLTDEN